VEVIRRFGRSYALRPQDRRERVSAYLLLIFLFAHLLTMMIEVTCTSEMSVKFRRIPLIYITKDKTLQVTGLSVNNERGRITKEAVVV
jgi:hypothetical protein